MRSIHYIVAIITTYAIAVTACSDTITSLGSSLVDDQTEVVIDSNFYVTGQPKVNDDIQSRTTTQLLGNITTAEYGHFQSDFATQFMPALQLDTVGVSPADIDSVKMLLFYYPGDFTGDSIVPMGLKVYPLTAQLPSPIFSNTNPKDYYNENICWTTGTQIYTGNALYNDSINNLSYRTVAVNLPREFGVKLFEEYINNPSTFSNPYSFAQFFPGLYVKNTFGSGRVINFNETRVNLHYKKHARVTTNNVEHDTVYHVTSTYLTVSPEIISNNFIDMSLSQSLLAKINAGETLLVAPASYDVELTFPAKEIINSYKNSAGQLSVINTLTFSIPVESIENPHNINPPANVLMVLSKDKAKFFADNKINDDITSFVATYNELTKSYDFPSMRQYILDLLDKDNISAEDYTFTITPVKLTSESSSSGYYDTGATYITSISPYVSGPAMCKLNLSKAKIKFTYSKQTL